MVNNNRKLDALIACLLGLDVLGEAPCYQRWTSKRWLVADREINSPKMQPVFLRSCVCQYKTDQPVFFNHIGSCLEVVPFYCQDRNLAVDALEQVCDEHELICKTYRAPDGWWIVELSRITDNKGSVACGINESLALAICKALAELRSEK